MIKSVNRFDDSEFSDYEMTLIDRIINEYGHFQPDALIKLLHEQGSLWKKIVDEQHLDKHFQRESTSQHKIDLSRLIANNAIKLQMFKNARESLACSIP